jgi:hypothetical protein
MAVAVHILPRGHGRRKNIIRQYVGFRNQVSQQAGVNFFAERPSHLYLKSAQWVSDILAEVPVTV